MDSMAMKIQVEVEIRPVRWSYWFEDVCERVTWATLLQHVKNLWSHLPVKSCPLHCPISLKECNAVAFSLWKKTHKAIPYWTHWWMMLTIEIQQTLQDTRVDHLRSEIDQTTTIDDELFDQFQTSCSNNSMVDLNSLQLMELEAASGASAFGTVARRFCWDSIVGAIIGGSQEGLTTWCKHAQLTDGHNDMLLLPILQQHQTSFLYWQGSDLQHAQITQMPWSSWKYFCLTWRHYHIGSEEWKQDRIQQLIGLDDQLVMYSCLHNDMTASSASWQLKQVVMAAVMLWRENEWSG